MHKRNHCRNIIRDKWGLYVPCGIAFIDCNTRCM